LYSAQEREQLAGSGRPLGVRVEVALSPAQLRGLCEIASYDLTVVRDRLVAQGAMLPRWAGEAVYEFQRYLALRLILGRPILMLSADVDEAWHTCILFTRLYADLCQRAFGEFVHHDPELESIPDRRAAWQEFEQDYRQLFGELTMLWHISAPLARNLDGSRADAG